MTPAAYIVDILQYDLKRLTDGRHTCKQKGGAVQRLEMNDQEFRHSFLLTLKRANIDLCPPFVELRLLLYPPKLCLSAKTPYIDLARTQLNINAKHLMNANTGDESIFNCQN